ncbi:MULTISPECIES: 6-phosphogluconolactonase [unclassified Brevundimonas]|uniref:6-phosphogluconolactonase n=1 Tax=unclassified Brevundimonas TaxID=2622653 RepID=UPI0006F38E9A|nr:MULTISPECIES: 6-phosphogluconolactonase [unclassified Brevundimonas]KQY88053.1 6-phosphogluconolactonase [Brevundimonas sp. Root1423]KRA28648.1 6-phosphogluconolactonase [Brevundimonas sp. Root608]
MTAPTIQTFPDGSSWAAACAARLTDTLAAALAETGKAVFAGAGGSTPAPIYRRMAQANLDWSRVAVTLVDERYVPETSPESNAALIKQALLTGLAEAARFVPLYHSEVTVDRAAAFAAHALAAEGGRLDAVLLGMGEDGHICSMFPNSPTLKTLLSPTLPPTVLGVPPGRDGAAPSLERLSINLPYLMGARCVVLALTGAAKRAVFQREAAGDPRVQPIAALVAANVPLDVLWTEKA